MKKWRSGIVMLCGVATLGFGVASAEAVTNASFEQGKKKKMPEWERIGQAVARGNFGAAQATDGKRQALLMTNQTERVKPKKRAASLDQLEAFVGATLGPDAFDGSAIQQTFTVDEDSQISFDWAFGQHIKGNGGNDIAFVVLDGDVTILGDLDSLDLTNRHKKFLLSEYQSFTLPDVLAAGEHTLSIGIVNIGTGTGRTALFLDNLILSAVGGGVGSGGSAVNPEPLTAGLTLMGVSAMAMAVRRRRHVDEPEA